MGDTRKSLEYLEAYSKKNPKDVEAQRLISDIKTGKTRMKTENAAPNVSGN